MLTHIFKSWKTSAAGAIVLVTWLGSQGLLPPKYADGIQNIAMGVGLLLAKDGDKSHSMPT